MMNEMKITQMNDLTQMVRREMERESEQLTRRKEQLTDLGKLIEVAEALFGENKKLKKENETLQVQLHEEMNRRNADLEKLTTENKRQQDEIESLKDQLADEKKQRAELEMKIAEMSKLMAGVAKKASEEAVLQALRKYVNISKRKTADKRAYAKIATLEMANANGVVLPEELAVTIDYLDDELSDQKVVNVTMHSPKIDGPLYGISHNENVNLGGRIHG